MQRRQPSPDAPCGLQSITHRLSPLVAFVCAAHTLVCAVGDPPRSLPTTGVLTLRALDLISIECVSHPDQLCDGSRLHFLHHVAAMNFDDNFTKAHLGGDLFVHQSPTDHGQPGLVIDYDLVCLQNG